MDQVAGHRSAASCWAAVDGQVYDLTSWINRHPGGPERILSICGTDATQAFTAQHGGGGIAGQILRSFRIGPLAG
ncbi:cytochrome b5 domain-containing protein [Nakamurella sp. DB0629]|uniref:Cytochrome b5 domain-containing protein n=2 Tax=Nakamurella aerolata TaxID=1656892 RepID=A0A849A9F4_9ACTN|nr:cytochrome b5-like heme/steroid binding domain-containing protein [Nakamurella aerolata]NNG37175.1 cytochrome b5 domain-containing protein [Nakamurella aerolata]